MASSEQAFSDSFPLSNAVPQNNSMNLSIWRRAENQVRKLASTADSVVVVTGAIFPEDPERIGSGVAVPSHLCKVLLVVEDGLPRLLAIMMPNVELHGLPLLSFTVPVAEVEKRTGLKFFPDLDRNLK